MKKRILSVVILIGMVCGLCACGSAGRKAATVTIEGETYDLSGDFQEVVVSMIQDGLNVGERSRYNVYDEEGMFNQEGVQRDVDYLWADERVYAKNWNNGTLLYSTFCVEGNKFDFESKLGITSASRKKEIRELEGFVHADMFITDSGIENRQALFVDGDMVDLSEYDDDYEEWVEYVKEKGIYAGVNDPYMFGDGFYYIIHAYEHYGITDIDAFIEEYDKYDETFKDTVVLQLALNDAIEGMENEEVDSCAILSFGLTNDEKDIVMCYINFYYDADYDEFKYWHMDGK